MSDSLEERLRAGGEKVAEGVFRIDARRALEKLREHRLAEPHHWVLEVLRSASSAGATRVEVETDVDDIILRFDGTPFPPRVMKDLLAQALDSTGQGAERRAARYLSLGIAGALGLGPKWIEVRSGQVALEILPPDQVTVSAAQEKGTVIQVRKRFGWSVITTALLDVTPEERAIADRTARYGPALTCNQEPLEKGELFEGGFIVSRSHRDKEMELEVGIPASGEGGVVVFVTDGVVVARRELVLAGRYIGAWARCDRMRRNASGSDVVDSDPSVVAVLKKVRALALEATEELGALIAAGKVWESWRTRYRNYALEVWGGVELDPQVRPALAKFPIIPGPHGEWYSPADFEAERQAGRTVYWYQAGEKILRGSYPTPIARLESIDTDPLVKLLPAGPLINAAKVIRARARRAQVKDRWLGSPVEPVELPAAPFLSRAWISAPGLAGELALVDDPSAGAFVRLLAGGRFLQQGEIASLAPLRLRAVVDWKKELPDGFWDDLGSQKAWSLIRDRLEADAQKAVLAGLASEQPRPFWPHGLDLLVRRATGGSRLRELPEGLLQAELIELTGEGRTSLAGLKDHHFWRFVGQPTAETLLSGEPVLVLPIRLQRALEQLAPDRLCDARPRLDKEREIRRRLEGPKRLARLANLEVVVELAGEGLTGQLGLPSKNDPGLKLTLLRGGVPVETTSLTATYEHAHAIVDCDDFIPTDDWDKVVRNPAFDRALAAVRAAEPRLADALVSKFSCTIDRLPEGCAWFLAKFLRKHSTGTPSAEARQVENAPLFRTPTAEISLVQLRSRLKGQPRLWTLPPGASEVPPGGMLVVKVSSEHATLLSALLGVRTEDAQLELARIKKRERFRDRALAAVAVPEGVRLAGLVAAPGLSGIVGLAEGGGRGASIEVRVEDRFFSQQRFEANLPLRGVLVVEGVDPADDQLPTGGRGAIETALRTVEGELLGRALDQLAAPGAREAVWLAVQRKLDRTLPTRLVADRLAELPLFPCTDGQLRSVRALDGAPRLSFVTEALEGAPTLTDPVVIAVEPEVREALVRWPDREDLTTVVRRGVDARKARLAQKPVETIGLGAPALWRRRLEQPGLEGEVGIVASDGGRLQLLHQQRPISTIEGALPIPLAAIANCDGLTLAALDETIVIDDAYHRLLAGVTAEAERMLDEAAAGLVTAGDEARRKAAGLLVPLAIWLVGRKRRSAALVKLPLFETTDGKWVSLLELLEAQKRYKSVLVSTDGGAPLGDARWVLRPRPGEALLLESAKLKLKDATASIRHAAQVRGRRKATALTVDTVGLRETLATDWCEGEVGLPGHPTRVLQLELHREHTLLETFSTEHPVGAVAKVNCDRLRPNGNWTRAVRNRQFKQLVAEVESAVERLLAVRVEPRQPGWERWAAAALRWSRPEGGPLAAVIPILPVFTQLGGGPVTVAAALAEHSRHGRVLIAQAGLPPPKDRLVLERSEASDELLQILGLKTEDTSGLLRRSVELEAELKARRLRSLRYEADAIARLALNGKGLEGELAVIGPHQPRGVQLAKEGILVGLEPIGKLPIGGVVNVEGLEVNETWTIAEVSRELKEKLEQAAEELFAALAAQAAGFPPAQKERARGAALEYLAQRGVSSACHLERMSGAGAALAGAPLFLSEDGQWVGLRAIADQVLRAGWISIFAKGWFKRDTGQELVLRAQTLREPWIAALEDLLGPSCVERVHDVALWRSQLEERDPPAGTAESEGLKRLRKELRLLRAGALGHVTPDELTDVRIRSGGAKAPIFYDPKRKLVFLDGADPQLARALAELRQRPERLYVLLAAIYGAVNRALARITDADEAQLLAALAAHLAANPRCLGPAGPD